MANQKSMEIDQRLLGDKHPDMRLHLMQAFPQCGNERQLQCAACDVFWPNLAESCVGELSRRGREPVVQTHLFSTEELLPHPEAAESLRALDELFHLAGQFSTKAAYNELLRFIARFRTYSPYNAMLIHTQMPGARYVATPRRWLQEYSRKITAGARPMIILQPRGPVLFVFDVSDTSPMDGAPRLPQSITNPFAVIHGVERGELDRTIDNAMRDGVRVREREFGSQQAGWIQASESSDAFQLSEGTLIKPRKVTVPVRYEIVLNSHQSREERYATLVHELGHLYCGHLGSPNERYWPSRTDVSTQVRECEAESISYLVCTRLGIETPSANYLSRYLNDDGKTPEISLDTVIKASGLIQQMGHARLPLRKDA